MGQIDLERAVIKLIKINHIWLASVFRQATMHSSLIWKKYKDFKWVFNESNTSRLILWRISNGAGARILRRGERKDLLCFFEIWENYGWGWWVVAEEVVEDGGNGDLVKRAKWSLIVCLTVEVFAGNGRQRLAFALCHKGELFGAPGALKPGGLSWVWHWAAQGAIWLVPPLSPAHFDDVIALFYGALWG